MRSTSSRSARASITPSSSGATPSPVASAPPASGLQASGTTPVAHAVVERAVAHRFESQSPRTRAACVAERERKVGRQRVDLGDRVVRDADLADLAGVTEFSERCGDVGGMAVQVGTVDLVEVDHVDLQAAQRRLARGPQVLRRRVVRRRRHDATLGGEHHPVAQRRRCRDHVARGSPRPDRTPCHPSRIRTRPTCRTGSARHRGPSRPGVAPAATSSFVNRHRPYASGPTGPSEPSWRGAVRTRVTVVSRSSALDGAREHARGRSSAAARRTRERDERLHERGRRQDVSRSGRSHRRGWR